MDKLTSEYARLLARAEVGAVYKRMAWNDILLTASHSEYAILKGI